MKIAISGNTGYIGFYLSRYYSEQGVEIVSLGRRLLNESSIFELSQVLSSVDVVINLAGAPINQRWTDAYKRKLHDSRIVTTRKLVKAINILSIKPKVFISASAVGYYPSIGFYDEYNSQEGDGFLAQLCAQWEHESKRVSSEVRLVVARLGVVLSPQAQAFKQMSMPARFKVNTILGSGSQPFPWIELNDLARAIDFIIAQDAVHGAVNMTTAESMTNKSVMKLIGKHYHSWLTIKIPEFFFRLVLGEASSFITEGQYVYPKKLLKSGFVFETPTLKQFLDNQFK